MSSTDIMFSKPSGHTFRNTYNRDYNQIRNTMSCSRPCDEHGMIPITEVDSLLSYRDIQYMNTPRNYGVVSLDKRNLFNDMINHCDKFATNKSITYDKMSGLDHYEYEVPVTNHINPAKIPHQEDINDPHPCQQTNLKMTLKQNPTSKKHKKRSYRYYETQKKAIIEALTIQIDGNTYNINHIYKRTSNGFSPIIFHSIPAIMLNDDERPVLSKITSNKISITVTFPSDTSINGFILKPEPMNIVNIYGDRTTSYIRVLNNEPNFVSKFKLYYRSSDSNGQWIEHGIYDGNDSIFSSTKISIDELVAKEIRIIPISHTGSFDKVSLNVFNHYIKLIDTPMNNSIKYELKLPHNFRHNYSREMDSVTCSPRCCDCSICKRNHKGLKKKWQREFADHCNY